MYGKSTSNQRIEAWWSQLRKSGADWWIKYFKDLRDLGIYCDGEIIHEQCLKFCYMKIIQDNYMESPGTGIYIALDHPII